MDTIDIIIEHLEKLKKENDKLNAAADLIYETILKDGLIYLFGCGHSHLITEDVFYRAGGLANTYPILIEPLMLHDGPVRSSQLEKKNDLAKTFLSSFEFDSKDLMIVFSTSGRNPVPIDVARFAKEKGLPVIVITSIEYSQSQSSRHKDDLKLSDLGNIVIDNYSSIGDVIFKDDVIGYGSISSIMGISILQTIFNRGIKKAYENELSPPVFVSGNNDHVKGNNEILLEKYGKRIPLLIKNFQSDD